MGHRRAPRTTTDHCHPDPHDAHPRPAPAVVTAVTGRRWVASAGRVPCRRGGHSQRVGPYTHGVPLPDTAAVLIPVKSFTTAKVRLAGVLDDAQRAALARAMAERVVAAAAPLPVWCVCDDADVRDWAVARRCRRRVDPRPGPERRGAGGDDPTRRRRRDPRRRRARRPALRRRSRRARPTPTTTRSCWSPTVAATAATSCRCPPARASASPTARAPSSVTCAEAARCGLTVRVVRAEHLGWDVDEPDDLRRARPPRTTARSAPHERPDHPTHPSRNLPVPERALVIVAHPDDAEFQAGATLAKWARQGCEVHHLVLTDGSKGTWDRDRGRPNGSSRRARTSSERPRRSWAAAASSSCTMSTASSTPAARCGPRCAPSSVACGRPSCSDTTRGSATACIPTTVRRASCASTASSPRGTRSSIPSS